MTDETRDAKRPPTREEFLAQFNFDHCVVGGTGIESEWYLVSHTGTPVPRIPGLLQRLDRRKVVWPDGHNVDPVTYELGACQGEFRTGICMTEDEIADQLRFGRSAIHHAARDIGLQVRHMEVAPEDICLDVYPSNRYLEITRDWPEERLRAACRVAGVHFHFSMNSWDMALECYDRLRRHALELLDAGDRSYGERRNLMGVIFPGDLMPAKLQSQEDLYRLAVDNEFTGDPRGCYAWLRLHPFGTIEWRGEGATDDPNVILGRRQQLLKIMGVEKTFASAA